MSVLLWGILLFGLAFLVHVVLWKIHLPQRQTRALLLIFFGVLLIGLVLLWSAKLMLHTKFRTPETIPENLHIALFVAAFTLAYIITYSALEADSPSLVMILRIAEAGSHGLPKEQFKHQMTDELLIVPRIRDLLRDHLVYAEAGKYKLTPKGVLFARIFIVYRRILNISQKGG
jgi:hypothetical protein